MKPPPIPENEAERITALRSYDVLDTGPEPQFDALVQLAAHIAGVPMALVSLIDTDRQWFKARYGLDAPETPRTDSFCGHAVAQGAALIVEDSHKDERFFDNPLVTGSPKIRFYAGMPLKTPDGHVLGTLCTLDSRPRNLDAEQLRMLDLLAQQAVALLEARRRNIALATFRKTLDRTHDAILIFAPDTLGCSYANEGATQQLGYSRDQLIGMTPYDLVPDGEHARVRHAISSADERDERMLAFDTRLRDAFGAERPVEVIMQHLAGDDLVAGRWISVVRDISERKRVEQMQSEFVSTVSHELRTPLTSIRGSLGLVAGGITGELPAEAKEYVDIALANSERLVRLINDILDVEKMQSGKMEFRIASVSLPSLLASTLAANTGAAAAAGSQLVLTAPAPEVEVAVDSDRFAQVITNLVSNAAKFAPAGSAIELSATLTGDTVAISVRDHGPGIPAEFRERMFQRFAQAEASSTRQKGGTGLGLSISKAIVERLGGTLHFEDAEGGGTRFIAELPALPKGPAVATRRRILICEDDAGVYRAIARVLHGDGFTVDIAPTLERAKRFLATSRYDAVTLDLVLADGEGSELIATLAERGVPVIVVSGSNRDLGRAAVLVTDVIAKPFREDRLLDAIRRVVPTTTKPRILHIEDDGDLRRIVRRTLPEDWDVAGAESMHHARKLLSESTYDAVVIDLGLPDGCGADLIPFVGPARVIIFTAQEVGADLSRRVSSALVKTRSTAADLRDVLTSLVGPESAP